VFPLTTVRVRNMPEEVRLLARDAERLGHWCARITLFEIGSTLKLRF
jgi:hypothetical protein